MIGFFLLHYQYVHTMIILNSGTVIKIEHVLFLPF